MDRTYSRGNQAVNVSFDSEAQYQKISSALDLIPMPHLPYVPPISVSATRGRGGAFSHAGGDHISLSRACFLDAETNGRHFLTLLHEIGHAVDNRLNAVARFVRECGGNLGSQTPGTGPAWETYRSIHYGGSNRLTDGTPKFGEHFADGYARYRANLFGSDRYRLNPAQREIIRRLAGE